MTDDRDDAQDDVDGEGVPDADPRHLDPAGDLADRFESGEIESENIEFDEDELREFLERAEAGEFDADPGLEATVRIARALLEDE